MSQERSESPTVPFPSLGTLVMGTEEGAKPPVEDAAEETPASSVWRLPLFHWKTFFLFFAIFFGIVCHWMATSELFETPPDVLAAREHFAHAKARYLANTPYWNAKLQHVIASLSDQPQDGKEAYLRRLQDLSPEICVAFLHDHLKLDLEHLGSLVIFPKQDSMPSLLLSKHENGVWPLQIMLSLEAEVKLQNGHFSILASRLRRGSKELTLGLAWAYFGPELERLRQFEANSWQSPSQPPH